MPELAGTIVSDRYELGDVLGQGGQGTVFRARDRKSGRDVAVKMLTPGVANNRDFAVRLAREQEALVALAGTSAVAVYDLCRASGGSLCLVMELLDGIDLEKHLSDLERRRERLSKERISAIFEPIVDTLERAHGVGIVHRDVKPSNIFLLTDGAGVRLLDFGLSRMKTAAPLTAAGMVVGSPAYIAPEIWKGQSEGVDGRADVYSLGVILYRCLSGDVPFESESLVEMLRLVTTAPRPSLNAARPDLPKAVDDWVVRALSVDRTQRFETVRTLYDGLFRALAYTPPPRATRPVADSLIGAWKAATSVFRRFIDAAASNGATEADGAMKTVGAREGPPALPSSPEGADDDGDRPTLIFKRPVPPPSMPPETRAIDDGWEEVADSEIHSSALAARADAARVTSSTAAVDHGWEAPGEAQRGEPKAKRTPKAPRFRSTPAKAEKKGKPKTPAKGKKPQKSRPTKKRAAPSPRNKASAKKKTKRPKPSGKSGGRKKPGRRR